MAWIGFDLDGTLAHHDGHEGPEQIGEPVPTMLAILQAHLAKGDECRIVTARANPNGYDDYERHLFFQAVEAWLLRHVGRVLAVGCSKDFGMLRLYDDRAAQVVPNEGVLVEDQLRESQRAVADAAVLIRQLMLGGRISVCKQARDWLQRNDSAAET